MDCEKVQELLSEYVDHMLDDDMRKDVENHINSCDACKQEIKLLKSIIGCCHEFEDQDLPENFSGKLHQRLLDERRNDRKDRLFAGFRKYGALAAALLVIAVSIGIFMNSGILGIGTKNNSGSADRNKTESIQAESSAAKAEAPEALVITGQDAGNQNFSTAVQDEQGMKAADTGAQAKITSREVQEVRTLTTAVINITEDEYNKYFIGIKAYIEGLKGYGEQDNPLVFIMPKENLDALIKKLSDDYDITNISVNATDISIEYDSLKKEISLLEKELSNLKEGEDRGSIDNQIEEKKLKLQDLDNKSQLVYIQINKI